MGNASETIPLSRPSVGDEEADAVRDALASGWIGCGPRTDAFETRFAAYVGAPYCVAVSSGTAALHLALLLLGLGPEDEVIVPALTFVSTAHAVTYTGARVAFADVRADTLTIDPLDVERRLGPRTRAIVPVHYAGHPCAMDELHALAAARGVAVVEDAAHAAGAAYKGRRIGNVSPLTCFSFNAVKNLTTGDGGAVTTRSAADAARLRRWRWLGIDEDTWQRARRSFAWRYEVAEVGFKYQMNDLAAAIGLVQLAKLERSNARRHLLAERYTTAFDDLAWLETPVVEPWATTAQHSYVVKLDRRDELGSYLAENGVTTGVHYLPLHLQPAHRRPDLHLPVCEAVWRRILLLPLYPDLTDAQQDYVIDRVRRFGRERAL